MNESRYRTLSIICSALVAIATFAAVILALFTQVFVNLIYQPELNFSFFEQEDPHLYQQVDPGEFYQRLFITIRVVNIGREVARSTQMVLTEVYYKDDNGNWKRKKNWIPVPLRWFPLNADDELDLIPKKIYFFDLGSFGSGERGKFVISSLYLTTVRPGFGPGEYYFKVNAYYVGIDKCETYFYIKFDDFEPVTKKRRKPHIKDLIKMQVKKVEMKDHPPL